MEKRQDLWSSKLGFILSTAGAAIGLGAIWKTPYVTGMNGGGAFFLVFVILTLLIGLPMLLSEFIIGRSTGKEAISAYKQLAPRSLWVWIGRIGVIGCFLLLSFYSVVGGWVLIYTLKSLTGGVIGEQVNYVALFGETISSPSTTLLGLGLFIAINVFVLAGGIQAGIERANKILMPLLFLFFIAIVIRSLTLPGAMEGVKFFLMPSFENMTSQAFLYALGQSFFSLAVGFSCMVTYSSYLKKDVSLVSSANSVVWMNIFVSLLAGLAIFPVVFSFGLQPDEGPGLLFMVLPEAFGQMAFGQLFLALFLLLFLFATLTSSFSLFEIIIAALTASGKKRRVPTTLMIGLIVFIAAIPSALSSSTLADFSIFNRSVFDLTDFVVSNVLLPLGSLLIAIFIGWKMNKTLVKEEFLTANRHREGLFHVWYYGMMKFFVPIVIAIVFVISLKG